AQQKDLYELRKSLNKKALSGTPLTPQFYLSQNPGNNSKYSVSSLSVPAKDEQAKLLNDLPNGNKVYALPEDNMPCIVPDLAQFNMPIFKPKADGIIPNGSRDYKVIPQ
ncbi:MAG: hypothetical protein ABUT20_66470, partial [Bacteroidota bacterium]